MSVAKIKLLNDQSIAEFYGRVAAPRAQALRLLKEGQYTEKAPIVLPGFDGEAAAEEMFDLTNNPSRQLERERLYGRGRSISVGDIVNVDGVDFLCGHFGWKVV